MSHLRAEADSLVDEVNSQPACWLRAGEAATGAGLPEHGRRVAFVGCGTSRYVAEAIAAWRESGGFGESGDAQCFFALCRRRVCRPDALRHERARVVAAPLWSRYRAPRRVGEGGA